MTISKLRNALGLCLLGASFVLPLPASAQTAAPTANSIAATLVLLTMAVPMLDMRRSSPLAVTLAAACLLLAACSDGIDGRVGEEQRGTTDGVSPDSIGTTIDPDDIAEAIAVAVVLVKVVD